MHSAASHVDAMVYHTPEFVLSSLAASIHTKDDDAFSAREPARFSYVSGQACVQEQDTRIHIVILH